jgi:integrase
MAGINKLTGADLRRSTPGRYGDGGGLWLQVTAGADGKTVNRSWLFRWVSRGRERWAGLGALHTISLTEARERARQFRQQVLDGVDPIAAREARRALEEAATKRLITFDQAAAAFIASKRAEWRSRRHAAEWPSSLHRYASPVIGKLPVDAIDTALVMKVLQPIWGRIPETASRLRGRIEAILGWATVSEYRSGDNPARWEGHLEHLLSAPSKRTKVSLAALPYDEVPAFMAQLRAEPGVAARALELAILTAARSGEARGATWGEIDLQKAEWTIPAGRMKAGREHRVPLSPRALEILRNLPRQSELVFAPGRDGAAVMSDTTLRRNVLRKLGRGDVTVHGFRSSFRTWAAERTNFAREIAEQSLAHAVGDATERAYKRTDMFDQRRRLMEMWAEFCSRPAGAGATVVELQRA